MKTPGMKQKDFKPCCVCHKGVMHTGFPLFLRMKVERFGIDRKAVQRAHGMELMLGGNAYLANIMGPDEYLATIVDQSEDLLVCNDCAGKPLPPYFWLNEDPEKGAGHG